MTVPTERADRIAAQLAERAIDLLVSVHMTNVRWLTGFTGSRAAAIVGAAGDRAFVTDFRYLSQAAEQLPDGWDRVIEPELLPGVAGWIAERRRALRVGFEGTRLTVAAHRELTERLPANVELVDAGDPVERQRWIKDEQEIAAIRRATEIADAAFAAVVEQGLAGRTERAVATELEIALRRTGADAASYPPIVAAGAHAALPHAPPRDVAIPRGALVVIDTGAYAGGYCSDCTRTYAAGEPSEHHREIYELVRRAQQAGVDALGPGRSSRAVDAVARDIIAAAGHGEHYEHSLGHGVGLEMGEDPLLNQRSDHVLEPGMVLTIEPGVYVPGAVGVRIEDLAVVTETGCDVLTTLPKALAVVD